MSTDTDTASSRPLVAIVDDEEDIALFLGLAFGDEGFRVATVSDPGRAMEVLEREPPDLICLDLLMPEMTGMSLYSAIVNHPQLSSRPVIMMSGLTLRGDLPGMLERGGGLPFPSAFFEKPIQVDELMRAATALLGRAIGVAP